MATVDIIELIKPKTGEKFYPYAHLNGLKGAEYLPRIGSSVQTTLLTPIFQVKDALNEQFYPQTHAEAVIGLAQMIESNQFFVKESDGNGGYRIKLKDEFAGLYANGWLAAGGVGTGGGGGGLITSVKGVSDLGTPIAVESLTETFSAYAIQSIYNSVGLKSAVALSNVLPYASGRVRVATLTIDGTNHDIYAPEPTGGGGVETETDPIFSASAAFSISATDITNWNAKVSNIQADWNATTGLAAILNKPSLSAVATSGSYNDLSNKPSIPTEQTVAGWGFTKNAGTVTSVGLTVPTGLSVSGSPVTASGTLALTFANGYSIPTTAKQSDWDAKYDKPSGGIPKTDLASAVQTSLGKADTALQSETDPTVPSWAKAESKPSYSLSEISGTADLRAIEALTGTGLLKRTGTNAWSLDTTAYLSAHQSVTLASGTNNGTLKLTTAAGTVDNIAVKGLGSLAYKSSLATADIPDISGTYVTLSGAQTITGVKTFSANMFVGGDIIPSTDLGPSLGYSSLRFANLNVRTIGSLLEINFKSQDNTAQTGYLTFKDGWMVLRSGADLDSSYKQINFHETYGFYPVQSGVNLGGSSANIRWQNIYGVNADLSGNLDVAGVVRVNSLNTIDQSNATMSLFNHGARATKSFNAYGTGINFRACDSNGDQVNILAVNATKIQAGSDIIPNYTAGLNLGGSSSTTRWATIYGVNEDLTGNLVLASSSHIDIGPLRIEYDATNKALHITKADGSDTAEYGIYADGFVGAGGIQES